MRAGVGSGLSPSASESVDEVATLFMIEWLKLLVKVSFAFAASETPAAIAVCLAEKETRLPNPKNKLEVRFFMRDNDENEDGTAIPLI